MDGVAGVTASDTRDAGVTVRIVLPATAPRAAPMDVVPVARLCARPAGAVVWMLAIDVFEDVQLTCKEISCVPPSLYVPVAVNCCLAPSGMDGFAGVTRIDWSAAGRAVRLAFAEIAPELAVIVALPVPIDCAIPLVLTVATPGAEEDQAAGRVRS